MIRMSVFLMCVLTVFAAGFRTDGSPNKYKRELGRLENRIADGTKITIREAAWQAAVFVNDEFVGGGSIIAPDTILTAASNIQGRNSEDITVGVGCTKPPNMKRKSVQSYRIHPKYNRTDKPVIIRNYNVAVIRLAKPIRINNDTVKVIDLATPDEKPESGEIVSVTGFGLQRTYVDNNNDSGDQLRRLFTLAILKQECQDSYVNYVEVKHIPFEFSDNVFCAGEHGRGTCIGDEGGALIREKLNTPNKQIGIVSFTGLPLPSSPQGCDQYLPDVYTDTTNPEIYSFIKARP